MLSNRQGFLSFNHRGKALSGRGVQYRQTVRVPTSAIEEVMGGQEDSVCV